MSTCYTCGLYCCSYLEQTSGIAILMYVVRMRTSASTSRHTLRNDVTNKMASDLLHMVALRNSKLLLFFLTLLVCIALLSAGVFCLPLPTLKPIISHFWMCFSLISNQMKKTRLKKKQEWALYSTQLDFSHSVITAITLCRCHFGTWADCLQLGLAPRVSAPNSVQVLCPDHSWKSQPNIYLSLPCV